MERVCPKCEYFAVLRHGHADNNDADERYKQGDRRPYDDAIKKPSSYHDLTEEGKLQAVKTGEWFERHGLHFSHHIVSGYIRALRTASLLNISDARWRIEERLCEKDRGILNTLTPSKVEAHITGAGHKRHEHDPYRFRPEHGESFLDLDVRIRSVFEFPSKQYARRVPWPRDPRARPRHHAGHERVGIQPLQSGARQYHERRIYRIQGVRQRVAATTECAASWRGARSVGPDHSDLEIESGTLGAH